MRSMLFVPADSERKLAKAFECGADALIIVTEWREFRTPDFDELARQLSLRLVFDGRNLYDPKAMSAFGLEYHCIGRPSVVAAGQDTR